MVNVEARLKAKGKQYEISVDVDEALKVKKGEGDVSRALNSNAVYYDIRKGNLASDSDLKDAFGTTDLLTIAKKIMESGEIQKPQEYRDAEREERIRQVVNLILRNAVDQHGRPFTEDRLRKYIDDIHFSFDKRPAEVQMVELVHKLKEVIPIKIEMKKIRLVIPARFTGQVYGMVQDKKESEEWLSNGDLQIVVNIPAGMQLDFYEKINGATHGAVQSEEIE